MLISNEGEGGLLLQDLQLQDVRAGVRIAGKGVSRIVSSAIDGAGATGAGIEVHSPDAEISAVDVSGFATGIMVKGDRTVIHGGSRVFTNQTGIFVAASIKGTRIEQSLIYDNDDRDSETPRREDGIRIEGGASLIPEFYTLVDGQMQKVEEVGESYEFRGGKIGIKPPLSIGEMRPSTLDFYACSSMGCSSLGQACEVVVAGDPPAPLRVTFDPATYGQAPIEIRIPPLYWGKPIVAIYTDPEYGTMGFTKYFKAPSGGVVVFVSTPYDIPASNPGVTSSSAEEEEVEAASEEVGGSMGGDGVVIEGRGESLASSAATGIGCALLVEHRAAMSPLSVKTMIGWFLLTVGALPVVRCAFSRIRKQ